MSNPNPHAQEVARFLGSDPVAGNEALEYFSAVGDSCLSLFFPQVKYAARVNSQAIRRLARLCRRFGEAATPILIGALENGAWEIKLRAERCFDFYRFGLGDKTADRLSQLLEHRDFDVIRCTLTALGYMAAYPWAYPIVEKIASPSRGKYTFSKLGSTALHALLMMASRTQASADIEYLLRPIELQFDALEQYDKPSGADSTLRWGALEFSAAAADPLVRHWLTHSKQIFRATGVESLSVIGLRRTASAIASRACDASESEQVRGLAMRYLGDIGGPVAVKTLQNLLETPDIRENFKHELQWGISNLYPEVQCRLDDDDIQQIVGQEWSQAKLHLLHGLGFRREGEDLIRASLHDIDPMVRGASALSLARLKGPASIPLVRLALREASDEFERALVLCGLIFAGEVAYSKELHDALCQLTARDEDISRLHIRWKREFVAALGTDPDTHLAVAWADALRVELDACEERLAEWKGSYPSPIRNNGAERNTEPTKERSTPKQSKKLVFVSYAHADKTFCLEFLKMVRPSIDKFGLSIWTDHDIPVGNVWREEIENALKQASVGVLLVSPDFLASEFIQKNELPPLLDAARTRGSRIFWIACRPCNVKDTEIGKFQGVNDPKSPLSVLPKAKRESELQRISQELFRTPSNVMD